MAAVLRLDELTRNPDSVRHLPHTAFEEIANTQVAANLLHIHSAVLVDEARITSDDKQPFDPREVGDDVLNHPVGKVVLVLVTAHVNERQHCN
jgi:hypothetical protein